MLKNESDLQSGVRGDSEGGEGQLPGGGEVQGLEFDPGVHQDCDAKEGQQLTPMQKRVNNSPQCKRGSTTHPNAKEGQQLTPMQKRVNNLL